MGPNSRHGIYRCLTSVSTSPVCPTEEAEAAEGEDAEDLAEEAEVVEATVAEDVAEAAMVEGAVDMAVGGVGIIRTNEVPHLVFREDTPFIVGTNKLMLRSNWARHHFPQSSIVLLYPFYRRYLTSLL